VAVETQDGWQSYAEATADDGGGGFNPGRFAVMRVQATKTPADQAKALLAAASGITLSNGAYVGDLTEAGAKAQLQVTGFGGRGGFGGGGGGGGAPADAPQIVITGAKASVMFWVTDGVLTKFQVKAAGSMQFGDQDPRDIDRTTTTTIKDVGTTTIVIPDEAKKKLP
jgi:hypothetical protein